VRTHALRHFLRGSSSTRSLGEDAVEDAAEDGEGEAEGEEDGEAAAESGATSAGGELVAVSRCLSGMTAARSEMMMSVEE